MKEFDLNVVECKGSAREMGRQYGEQAREEIRDNVAFWGGGRLKPNAGFLDNVRGVLGRFIPEVLEEMEGMAEGAGVSLDSVLLMNHVNTFGEELASPGCTSFAISGGPDGPVLGKNNDGGQDDRCFVVRRSVPEDGLPMIQVTYAGWLSGLDAMNAAGLVNGHNSVGSVFDKSGERLDIRLWAYHLMRHCRSSQEFLAQMDTAPLTGKGFNIVLVDAAGDTCVLEAAVPLIACRDRGKEFVFATNHYVSEPLREADRRSPEHKPVTIYRYGYLRWLAETSPPKEENDVRAILASHAPWAPCRHGGPHLSFTLWSMVGLPREKRLLVASGPPCSNDYRVFDVCDLSEPW